MDAVQPLIFKAGRRPATSWANGQLILRKINKIGTTRCQILRLKCIKFDFRCGSAPYPDGGAYSAPPIRLGAYYKGERGRRGRGMKGREEGKGVMGGTEGRIAPPPNWGVWIRRWRRGGKGRRTRRIAWVGASRHFLFLL